VTRLPAFDLAAGLDPLREPLLAAMDRVLRSGRLLLGEELLGFESELAAWLGEGSRAVGVSSGTAALVLALRSVGVGPGDEVVTVANTAVPTVSAIRELGAVPVFCDVREDSALLDLEALPGCLTAKTRAVVPVHLYGNAFDVVALRAQLDSGVAIVEDCAQAQGASLGGRKLGTLGDAAAFSFYPTKNLGALGDAGACVTRDPERAALLRSLRMYGFEGTTDAQREGFNARMDELQAAALRVKLPHLDAWVARRRALATRYVERLDGVVPHFVGAVGSEAAPHLFVVRVGARERVRAALDDAGIGTGVHYPVPIHRMPAYAFLGLEEGRLPVTERLAREVVSLPFYPELSDADVDRVCDALRASLA
jgi:dTDP-4-amino-4,6-dideoxygalactose transaminase